MRAESRLFPRLVMRYTHSTVGRFAGNRNNIEVLFHLLERLMSKQTFTSLFRIIVKQLCLVPVITFSQYGNIYTFLIITAFQ